MDRNLALSLPLIGVLLAALFVALLPGMMGRHTTATPVSTSQLFQEVARGAPPGGAAAGAPPTRAARRRSTRSATT